VADVAAAVAIEDVDDDRSLGLDHLEAMRPNDPTELVADRPVAEWVESVVAPGFVLRPRQADHALTVEVALELRGEGQLAEQEAPDGRVELAVGQVADDKMEVSAIKLGLELEHEPRVAREA
jgi:hypothetical protein